jgi:YesN/AraC family two-component response regulator
VEDDDMVNMAICRILARRFPESAIYTAENGLTGLELFKEHSPDIVITDINMPLMDGIEMAYRIRSINSKTKFIVLTGYSDGNYLEKFSEIGFDEYMVKPVDFRKLFTAVEKCRAGTMP